MINETSEMIAPPIFCIGPHIKERKKIMLLMNATIRKKIII